MPEHLSMRIFKTMQTNFAYLAMFGVVFTLLVFLVINNTPSFSYKYIFKGSDPANVSITSKSTILKNNPNNIHEPTAPRKPNVRTTAETIRLLVLAYARSGSTYTGQLFSSPNSTLYFFEPSSPYVTQRVQEKILKRAPKFEGSMMEYLKGLFFCDADAYTVMSTSSKIRSMSTMKLTVDTCMNASMVVMKTVRIRFNATVDWLLKEPSIKVIHLVRDPRGIVASTPPTWMSQKNPYHLCQDMNLDLAKFKLIPEHRRILLRYEDLIENPVEKAKGVLEHFKIPWQPEIESFVEAHYSNDPNAGSTARPRDFTSDHKWRQIPAERRAQIESACKEVMMELNYPLSSL